MFDIIAYNESSKTSYVMATGNNKYYGISMTSNIFKNIHEGNRKNPDGSIPLFETKPNKSMKITKTALFDNEKNIEIGYVTAKNDYKFNETNGPTYGKIMPANDNLLLYVPD